MTAVRDVAAYIEQRMPGIGELRLLKLAYYAQAWHAAWEGAPLFDDRIEAWIHGPVPVSLRRERQGTEPRPVPKPLDENARTVVDAVLDFYGHLSTGKLRSLSHQEAPWRDARGNLPAGAPSTAEITLSSMRRFYTQKSLRGEPVPQRRSRMVEAPTNRVLAIADQEIARWKPTLAWLAER